MLRDVTGPTVRPGGLTLTREAADRCDLNPGARVLDIGCGTGATVVFLTTEKRWRVAGLDRSDILLKDGRATHDDMPLMIGDAQHLPLPGGCLDAVFMECVLSLAEMPARVLAECERVLVPAGGWPCPTSTPGTRFPRTGRDCRFRPASTGPWAKIASKNGFCRPGSPFTLGRIIPACSNNWPGSSFSAMAPRRPSGPGFVPNRRRKPPSKPSKPCGPAITF